MMAHESLAVSLIYKELNASSKSQLIPQHRYLH